MPTFTQAKLVEPGEKLSSDQLGALAAAFNSRILSGVGDAIFRIPYYLHTGLWRQIRNPDESFNLYPPDGEFWNIYEFVRPEDSEWPISGPGDPEGTNVANILGAFIYGNDGIDIGSELRRLASIPVGFDDGLPFTPSRLWVLGQQQRGAYDPNTGAAAWPVGDVARAYAWVRQGMYSPHGNSYGGFLARPQFQYGCTDPLQPNPLILFTNFKTGATRTYSTNCPEDVGAVGISYSPFAYYVFHTDGAYEILSKTEWLEGPYDDNAALSKTQANALARVLVHYGSEFRGTPQQGAGQSVDHAFDLDKFLKTQYPLAPNVGSAHPDGSITVTYPSWKTTATTTTAGASLRFVSGGTNHSWMEGTVCTGFLIVAAKLARECTVEIMEGDQVLKSFELGQGDSDQIYWLPEARKLASVRVVARDELTVATGGGVFVEATELLEYFPQVHDYYLVTRLSSFRGTIDRIDGRGIDTDLAQEIGTGLYKNGCIVPVTEAEGLSPAGFDPTFNQNAVVDGARRFTLACCRIVPRGNLEGYAVTGGKSILWFSRDAYGGGPEHERDMWQGIGPSILGVESGEIKWGETYIVNSGSINYGPPEAKKKITAGKTFVGLQGIPDYDGTAAVVREVNGIRAKALPQDHTNRWALSLTLKPYTNSQSSIWKSEAFADIITPFWNRCHFDAPEVSRSPSTLLHECFGQAPAYIPEAPSGFNYAQIKDSGSWSYRNVNLRNCAEDDPDCIAERLAFYKSCRIYEPPLEIEKVEHEVSTGFVKVTLSGRLHHHPSAPSTIDRDQNTWNLAAMDANEVFRTHENGIRDYLSIPTRNAPVRIGDHALNSFIAGDPDSPFGSSYPTFFMVRLVPQPYIDQNKVLDPSDSPIQHDQVKFAELYLRAMCEGYVDGVTSLDKACVHGTVSAFDYTFENLMFQAAANRWVPLTPESVRPDNPYGFGPLPTLDYYATTFNALAAGVNLLTDARIMLPLELLGRTNEGTGSSLGSGRDQCGASQPCAGTAGTVFAYSMERASAGGGSLSAWSPFSGGMGSNYGWVFRGGTSSVACSGNSWIIDANKIELEVKWSLVDPDSYNALPGDLGALLDTSSVAMMSIVRQVVGTKLIYLDAPYDGSPAAAVPHCGSKYAWVISETVETSGCSLIHASVPPPEPGGGPVWISISGGGGPPGTEAGGGPASSATVDIFTDNVGIVRCPTVTYTEE